MTKSDTLYRAGYIAAKSVETLSCSSDPVDGELWIERNERLDKIDNAKRYGWNLIRYAVNAADTNRNLAQFTRGFNDRMTGKGYSLNK